jgi:hypothetical protein
VYKFAYTSSSMGTRRITRQVQPNSPGKTRRITLIPVFCSVATHTPIRLMLPDGVAPAVGGLGVIALRLAFDKLWPVAPFLAVAAGFFVGVCVGRRAGGCRRSPVAAFLLAVAFPASVPRVLHEHMHGMEGCTETGQAHHRQSHPFESLVVGGLLTHVPGFLGYVERVVRLWRSRHVKNA